MSIESELKKQNELIKEQNKLLKEANDLKRKESNKKNNKKRSWESDSRIGPGIRDSGPRPGSLRD